MPTLQFFLPDSSTLTFELIEAEKLTLGSAAENDLPIADNSISRFHAELWCQGSEYRIKDLGSTNKTWINDVAVVDVPLKEGATLRLGHVEGRLVDRPGGKPAPRSLPPMALLRINSGEQAGVTHRFRATTLTLGWKSQNLICLKDPSVSGTHAEVTFEKGVYRIKDLQSSNHTFLNGEEVSEAELHHGDTVNFGALEATFLLADSLSLNEPAPDDELARLRQENASLKKELDAIIAKSKGDSKQSELNDLRSALEEARKNAESAENVSATHLKELKQQTEALGKLKESVATQEEKASSAAKEQATTHQAALEAKEKEWNAAKAALLLANDKAQKQSEKEQAELRTALEEARKGIESATSELARLRAELDKAKESVPPSSSEELQAALKEIESLSRQREAADMEAATLAAKLDDERQQSDSMAGANTQLQLDLDQAHEQVKDLERRLALVTGERDTAQNRVIELEHQFAALQSLIPEEKGEQPKVSKPVKSSPATVQKRKNSSDTIKLESSPATVKSIIDEAPHAFTAMRKLLHTFIKNQRETTLLDQLLSGLHGLSTQADKAQLAGAVTMTRALEALVGELINTPSQITPSTLRSISQSLDFLATLFQEQNIVRLHNPLNASIFAVDDDADSRKVIRAAMEVIQLKVTCAEDPAATLAMLDEQVFDLIFIDVGLPEMNGFELCTKIRALPQHRKTPVVFLTGAVTVQNRVQSSLSGGNDFIAKPFNLLELGVKALTWILKGQLGLP